MRQCGGRWFLEVNRQTSDVRRANGKNCFLLGNNIKCSSAVLISGSTSMVAVYIVVGKCFVFGFKQSNLGYSFKKVFCLQLS